MKTVFLAFCVVFVMMRLTPVAGDVGCAQCNGLNVQCVSKNAVMTCLGTPKLIRCPSGTFCNVNLLPWCSETYTPLCPR